MADKYDIYRAAELGGRVGLGAAPAIVVVDFQRSFVDPSVPGGGDFSEAIEATRALLDAARDAHGVPILFTVTGYENHSVEAGRFLDKCPTLEFSTLGTPMVDLDDRLDRRRTSPCS